jgi:hypothetical protein
MHVLLALDVAAPLFLAIRITFAIVGMLIGWFLGGPLSRGIYRLAFQRPIPGWMLPWMKLLWGSGLAALLFFFLPLGGGGGWGTGGTGWGLGNGSGTGTDGVKDGKPNGDPVTKVIGKKGRETLTIELVGGVRYLGEDRYYLIDRKEPAASLAAVEKKIASTTAPLEIEILLGKDEDRTVGPGHDAVKALRELADQHKIPSRIKQDEEKAKDP